MSTLETRKIEPLSGTTVTLGAAGDAVTMPAGVTLKTNTVKDAGGNTIWTSNGSGTLSSVNSALQGNMVFISSTTASSSSSISFTSGIDSTYDEYMFVGTTLNPATNSVIFSFQVNASGQSGFNETITSTMFRAYHAESDSEAALANQTGADQAQGSAYQPLTDSVGNGADECAVIILYLYAPSNTTYVKHWQHTSQLYHADNYSMEYHGAGYFNVTAAITEIDFKFSSGNINAGTIAMYGIN